MLTYDSWPIVPVHVGLICKCYEINYLNYMLVNYKASFTKTQMHTCNPIYKLMYNKYVCTVISLFETPYLIETPPNGSASCHKVVNEIEATCTFNDNLTKSIHKYRVQVRHMLLKTHYQRPCDAHLAGNISALGSVLAPGASNRDNTVFLLSWVLTRSFSLDNFSMKYPPSKHLPIVHSSQ